LKENNHSINKEKKIQHARLDGIARVSFGLAILRLAFTRLVK
jgi:hypothetical protein